MRGAPTLEEVAARAGVSRATASRVLRGADNVSLRTKQLVETAADQLGYVPNLVARSLVTGRTGSVAFLVEETEERLFSDPFFLSVLRGAHDALAASGTQLVFTVANSPEQHRRFVSYAAGGHVDGVLLLSLHGRDELPLQLEQVGVPTVLSGRPLRGSPGLSYIDADNVRGGRLAAEHLLASGRQRVAVIAGPQDMCAGQDRLTGYREALEGAGIGVDPSLVVETEFTQAGGTEAAVRLLRDRPDVDGIVAASDLIAIGAIRALRTAGRSVPEDIAVVGFDDIPDAALQDPPLTTIRQPIDQIGANMAEVLLHRIDGDARVTTRILPVSLVRRGTA
jgi:DNA-binding LacI/PurR family transcriptional regulator